MLSRNSILIRIIVINSHILLQASSNETVKFLLISKYKPVSLQSLVSYFFKVNNHVIMVRLCFKKRCREFSTNNSTQLSTSSFSAGLLSTGAYIENALVRSRVEEQRCEGNSGASRVSVSFPRFGRTTSNSSTELQCKRGGRLQKHLPQSNNQIASTLIF